jgi:hypothetical protein
MASQDNTGERRIPHYKILEESCGLRFEEQDRLSGGLKELVPMAGNEPKRK